MLQKDFEMGNVDAQGPCKKRSSAQVEKDKGRFLISPEFFFIFFSPVRENVKPWVQDICGSVYNN